MKKLIIGTDWWTDCDDAVAMRIFARAHLSKKIELLGIIINACAEYSVASLDAFLELEGMAEMPIGIDLCATDFGGNPPYQKRLAEYATRKLCNADGEDPVRLYRRLLAESNGMVEIAEIGFPQVLSHLIQSKGDDISPLDGRELMAEKVHCVWMMAGKWECGLENNFCRNPRSRIGGAYFTENCPVPVVFLGFEVGETVISGGHLKENDHLHTVLADFGSPGGRSSWDPMLAMLASGYSDPETDYKTVIGHASVNAETGENSFFRCPEGLHRYVIKTHLDEWHAMQIDKLIESKAPSYRS